MGRFRADEISNYGGQGGTGYFSLKQDKETAQVRFMYNDMDDIEGYAVHPVEIDGKKRYVNCLRNYNDPIDACPFCKNRMFTQAKLFIPVYNETQGRVQIWERGKKFYSQLSSVLSRSIRGNSIVSQMFEIERNGQPRDTGTTYQIYQLGNPDNTTLESLPEKPNVLGSIVLDKTAEEMDYYIHNNVFPSTGAPVNRSASNDMPIRRRTESSYNDSNSSQPIRRTPSRREDVY